ncbi:MAG: polysaccharide biosynthesis protein [Bacteroidetes bacterium]|nr:polysaccharide biosynthesis protein [Bacteroidota bacterium]
MSPLKQLFGQTAVYGMSGIIGRVLNYLLVPLYTRVFTTEQYGIVTEMYAYVSFLVILLTYGMETSFFRFYSNHTDKEKVYNTTLISLIASSLLFLLFASLFSSGIGAWLHYPDHSEYVIWFAVIVSLDAIAAIPFAKLRALNKIKNFFRINFANIIVNIGLNLFFLVYCKENYENGEGGGWLVQTCYNPEIGVGYVFISNLVASIVKIILLVPWMMTVKAVFDFLLWKNMMRYALPLLIAGIAGIVNENADRIMLKHILVARDGAKSALEQVGIYGACYKVSIIISLFIQAFRFAADPFFFSRQSDKNAKKTYSDVLTYFVVACLFIFLVIMLFIDTVMYFVGSDFREGVTIVPVLLIANICLGIYFNLSFWYKLTGKTEYGAYIAIFGAVITVFLNYLWIPVYGYMGSAWATCICYFAMMLISYFLGRKHYPVNYQVGKISLYAVITAIILLIHRYAVPENWNSSAAGIALLLIFAGFFFFTERKTLFIKSTVNGN